MNKQKNILESESVKRIENRIRQYWFIFELKISAVLLLFLILSGFITYHWFIQSGLLSSITLGLGLLIAFTGMIVLSRNLKYREIDVNPIILGYITVSAFFILLSVFI